MNNESLKKLKLAVNQFYLNKYTDEPIISDEEYDDLVDEYETEYGGSVKDLVEWESKLTAPCIYEEPLSKIVVKNDHYSKFVEDWIKSNELEDYRSSLRCNLKYDGCAIKAIYQNGILKMIQSTPDEEFGIIRTESFWNMFPHEIPFTNVVALRGEVLVDANEYGQLARNKANGLTNSEFKASEVEAEAFIRIYNVQFEYEVIAERLGDISIIDPIANRVDKRLVLNHLPKIERTRNRPAGDGELKLVTDVVFSAAEKVDYTKLSMTDTFYDVGTAKFQFDGIVMYSDYTIPKGFKLYATEYAVTTVKDIVWNKKSNGSFAPVVMIEPVTLNDKYIQKVSANGVPNMIDMAFGIGAKVKVILANLTIPKIEEVLEESTEFNWPSCECGYKMTADDTFGSTLKCGRTNGPCKDKVNKWLPEVAQWLVEEDTFKDCVSVLGCIKRCPHWFGYLLYIDRWDPFDMVVDYDKESVVMDLSVITDPAHDNYEQRFIRSMKSMFRFTELQEANFDINVLSALEVFKKLITLNSLELIKKGIINKELCN